MSRYQYSSVNKKPSQVKATEENEETKQTKQQSINTNNQSSGKAMIFKSQSRPDSISYEYIAQSHNLIYLVAQSQIENFNQFNELFLLNEQQIYSMQLIIENSQLLKYPSKLHHKSQSIFLINNTIKSNIYDEMIQKKEFREFIENSEFLKNIDGVSFYQLQTIHTTSEQYLQTFQQYFQQNPYIVKTKQNMRLIIQLRAPTQRGDVIRGEIVMTLSLKNIQNKNNQNQRTDFQIYARQIKYEILGYIQNNDWKSLFSRFQDVIYRCYLQDIISKTLSIKLPILDKLQIQNGINICKYQDTQYVEIMLYVQQSLNNQSQSLDIKRLLNNPQNLQKSHIIENYPWTGFIFSPKADGNRCLLVSKGYHQYIIKEMKIQRLQDSQIQQNFIVEAEQVGNELLCYDILLYNDEKLINVTFSSRLDYLQEFVQYMNTSQKMFGQQYQVKIKDYAIIKKNVKSEQLKEILEKLLTQTYQTDGLIINTDNVYYKQKIYKWKPKELLSIDFYVKSINRNKIASGFDPTKSNYIPMVLFTHISQEQFKLQKFETIINIQNPSHLKDIILVPFQPALCPNCFIYWRQYEEEKKDQIDGKVCEFAFDIDKQEWIFLRTRDDKNPQKGQFGNYFSTAEYTFHDIINYIDLQTIYDISLTNKQYFEINTQLQYKQMTQYMNFIKRIIINYVCNYNQYPQMTIMDFGIGKGQDLNKYAASRVQKIIGIDNDLDAIKELVQRKNQSTTIKYPTIQLGIYDLSKNEDILKLVDKYKDQRLHAIFSMFSIHYFMSNFESLLNAFNLVKQGGFVVIVCMDGQKVFDMLSGKNYGEHVAFTDNNNSQIKYQYVKEYNSNTLLNNNQFIKLKLPFSENLMSEQLVNIKYIVKRLKERNFTLNQDFSCDLQGTYNQFSKDDLARAFEQKNQLSVVDLSHIQLYRTLIFKKK